MKVSCDLDQTFKSNIGILIKENLRKKNMYISMAISIIITSTSEVYFGLVIIIDDNYI